MKYWFFALSFCALLMFSSLSLSQSNLIEQRLTGSLRLIGSPQSDLKPGTPWDVLELPSVTIPFNVVKLAGRDQLRSTFQWAGKTTRGFQVDWQLAGPGVASVDWNAQPAKFTFELPFIFTCVGKKLPIRLTFTAGPHTDSFGSAQGFARKTSDSSADLLLHAPATFRFSWKDLFPEAENREEVFVGRVTFTGKLNGVNGSKLF